jgi:hypothetical protein
MVIYLDDYRKARAMKSARARAEQALRGASRNPPAGAFALACSPSDSACSPQPLAEIVNFDVAGFLDRVYSLASQI